jgi:hypothetical protein
MIEAKLHPARAVFANGTTVIATAAKIRIHAEDDVPVPGATTDATTGAARAIVITGADRIMTNASGRAATVANDTRNDEIARIHESDGAHSARAAIIMTDMINSVNFP